MNASRGLIHSGGKLARQNADESAESGRVAVRFEAIDVSWGLLDEELLGMEWLGIAELRLRVHEV